MTAVEGHASEDLAAMDRDLRLSLLRIKQLQENEEREQRRKLELENRKRKQAERFSESTFLVPPAPEFHPSHEEFQDPVKYIESIEPTASRYGICKVIPPSSWKPSFCPRFNSDCQESHDEFNTKLQRIRNRVTVGEAGVGFKIAFENEHRRYNLGEFQRASRKVSRPAAATRPPASAGGVSDGGGVSGGDGACDNDADGDGGGGDGGGGGGGGGGGECGGSAEADGDAAEAATELAFWRTMRNSRSFAVQYGSDVDGTACGPEFGPWSLEAVGNVSALGLIRQSGAVDIVGVNVPMVYVGQRFSMFGWHYEDNALCSLNFMHTGRPKTWYGVPGGAADRMSAVAGELFRHVHRRPPDHAAAARRGNSGGGRRGGGCSGGGGEQGLDLSDKCTMVSPDVLKARGVPIYRLCQRPGEFVITFPLAFHSGFSHGFNVGEATNFALPSWIPHGIATLRRCRARGLESVLDLEKMALDAAALLPARAIEAPAAAERAAAAAERAVEAERAAATLRGFAEAVEAMAAWQTAVVTAARAAGVGVVRLGPGGPGLEMTDRADGRVVCAKCQHAAHVCFLTAAADPSRQACPEHAAALGCREARELRLHVRYSDEELNDLVAGCRRALGRRPLPAKVEPATPPARHGADWRPAAAGGGLGVCGGARIAIARLLCDDAPGSAYGGGGGGGERGGRCGGGGGAGTGFYTWSGEWGGSGGAGSAGGGWCGSAVAVGWAAGGFGCAGGGSSGSKPRPVGPAGATAWGLQTAGSAVGCDWTGAATAAAAPTQPLVPAASATAPAAAAPPCAAPAAVPVSAVCFPPCPLLALGHDPVWPSPQPAVKAE